jgi:hypothetical protein
MKNMREIQPLLEYSERRMIKQAFFVYLKLFILRQILRPAINKNSRPIPVSVKSAKQQVQEFLDYIVDKQMDITQIYNDWLGICIIIAQNFREDGRDLFHAISQFCPDYSPDECNQKYDDILSRSYKKPINRLYEIAEKYGL